MITEDYVSFEVAKLLKEKGFNLPCRTNYRSKYPSIKTPFFHNALKDFNGEYKGLNSEWYSAPTLQMAMKWLREVHKTSIEIISTGYLIDNDAEWECDIKIEHRLYFKHITGEKSFESCANKAIKYCLENLI